MIDANPTGPLSDNYKVLIQSALSPTVWNTRGSVTGCTRFLVAVMPKAKDAIVEANQLVLVLECFSAIMGVPMMEQYAFDLLEAVCATFPA